jgi:uncharacterized protein (DUF924 family)
MSLVKEILDFWFGAPDSPEFGQRRQCWFVTDPEFDAQIQSRFGHEYEKAARGEHDSLAKTAEGALALIIMLDQFPRNLFRGSARAFATDPKALSLARAAVAAGHDRALNLVQRCFVYLPFEHSEDLADQDESVRLFEALGDPEFLEFAIWHRDIIVQFGRYPHRNAILGRDSTAAELAFLEQPGSSF